MAATIAGVFNPELQNLIKESKILLVGAGGIGCEVLKNLVLTGFSELEVIDLDTIEVSNLNRQFLFSKESVGKAKSHVAKTSVLKFNPNVNIMSHFGDIMDTKYGVAFFNKFKLVINALDNKKARSHVNRMCLSCQIPLIESGTMGYNGQVEFIKKGVTICYECNTRAEPRTYPMCTIRNTPKEPIHCIIWAKFLFNQLFGEIDEIVSFDEENIESEKLSARNWAIQNDYNPKKLFKKVFFDDIKALMNMKDLYADKKIKPVLLDESLLDQEHVKYSDVLDSEMLTLEQNISMFLDCVTPIKEQWEISTNKCLVWDKDDDMMMNFVVSCSNLRSALFNIPFKTHFDIKSMAGNIIPAIATANAMIAGQIVIHALRILRGKFEKCQNVFLRSMPNHKGGVLVKDRCLQPPNPKCNVCSSKGEIIFTTDMNNFTVRQLEELVLKKKLNMVAPDVTMLDRVIISSDETDGVDMYDMTLSEAGMTSGCSFDAEDDHQNFRVKIIAFDKEKSRDEDPDFEIFNNKNDLHTANEQNNKTKPDEDDEDDCFIDQAESTVCDNNGDTREAVNHLMVDKEEIGYEEVTEGGAEEIGNEEEEITEKISNEEIDAEEISNEEKLAIKRKADEAIEDINDAKKSRVD
ncbi:unnamed protein product [Macrosiphum euphorbiae]|uniref:SUMO-activating enzyme subunit n=1 Tax=Macrosiphum euphorbiae TaxID=13131 RepID=A0AAV0W5H0_9HEMI|nr:unnamed protein product [Macrosiphum euphorbiae]